MRTFSLWKAVPLAALLLAMNVPTAIAGGTNRDDNTSAEPGDKATTTREATDPAHDRRKGTTQTDQMDTPDSASDVDSSGSGNDSTGSGSNSGNQY